MGFWVFGYGSLVWNPGFEYDEKVIGFVRDYRRVFDVGMFSSSFVWFPPSKSQLCQMGAGIDCV